MEKDNYIPEKTKRRSLCVDLKKLENIEQASVGRQLQIFNGNCLCATLLKHEVK